MALQHLAHCSIRTDKLAETRRFYIDVLGLSEGPRPNFPFPGVWLYLGDKDVIHIVGIDPDDPAGLEGYLGGRQGGGGSDTGSIDHVAFVARNVSEIKTRLEGNAISFRQRTVPGMDLEQIFVVDPNGVTIELNFPGEAERA
jgi:catechol 2,3-dioxygenase-like lactoylglutathione lyase family enzyme